MTARAIHGKALLHLLRCPQCGARPLTTPDGAVGALCLRCQNCQALFPVIDDVPRLLSRHQMPRCVSGYGQFLDKVKSVDRALQLPEAPHADRQDPNKAFRGVGGRDYHETRIHMPTVRYSLKRRIQALGEVLAPFQESGIGSLLEVGCADGLIARSLSDQLRVAAIVGVDLQDDQLPLNPYPVFQGDCQNLPFADERFDAVVAGALIEHLPDPKAFLAHAHRVLKPGGMIAVTCPDPGFDWLCTVLGYFKHAGHLHRFSIDDVARLLKAAGFTDVAGRKFMLAPFSSSALERLEKSLFYPLLRPLMMNQVIHARK